MEPLLTVTLQAAICCVWLLNCAFTYPKLTETDLTIIVYKQDIIGVL